MSVGGEWEFGEKEMNKDFFFCQKNRKRSNFLLSELCGPSPPTDVDTLTLWKKAEVPVG